MTQENEVKTEDLQTRAIRNLKKVYTKAKIKKFQKVCVEENIANILDFLILKGDATVAKDWEHIIIYDDDRDEPLFDALEGMDHIKILQKEIKNKLDISVLD